MSARRALVAALTGVLVGAPSAASAVSPREAAERINGAYDNAAQIAAADPSLLRPPAAGRPYAWIDLQHATFHRVEAPQIGPAVLYLEWRSGGPDGAISRQRIWSFRTDADGATVMDFFTIRSPEPFAGRGGEPSAFLSLSPTDLIGYGPACALQMRADPSGDFVAETTAERCRIVARSGRAMGIEARIAVRDGAIEYAEAGVLEGGDYAFKVPGAGAYAFRRTRP